MCVTNHTLRRRKLEAALSGDELEIDCFPPKDETQFLPERLVRLDALTIWDARLGARSIPHLARYQGVMRYRKTPTVRSMEKGAAI